MDILLLHRLYKPSQKIRDHLSEKLRFSAYTDMNPFCFEVHWSGIKGPILSAK